ncbi:hypothetical protein PZH32_13135, partial [Adlercreutzia equolifaciens]|uniref:hypothetical protein n=1 Tax=Adlercreutzia equolifaciens TaxID=446660 RepID=UPI0023AEA711
IGDYTDDDYAFYVERRYRDRHATVADLDAEEYVVDKEGHKIEGKTVPDIKNGEGVSRIERLTPREASDPLAAYVLSP